jgi:hypothetical protein
LDRVFEPLTGRRGARVQAAGVVDLYERGREGSEYASIEVTTK